MEKTSFLLMMAMMISAAMFAQERDPNAVGLRKAEKMKAVLALDDDQYASIKGIHEKYAEKHRVFRRENPGEPGKNSAEMKQLFQEREKEIEAVLSAEQKTTWESYKQERRDQRGEKGKRGGKAFTDLKTSLSLTDEQFAKLQAVNAEYRAKVQNLRNEAGSGGDQKQDAFQALRAEHDVALKKILNAEQFEKWNSLKEERKSRKHRMHK